MNCIFLCCAEPQNCCKLGLSLIAKSRKTDDFWKWMDIFQWKKSPNFTIQITIISRLFFYYSLSHWQIKRKWMLAFRLYYIYTKRVVSIEVPNDLSIVWLNHPIIMLSTNWPSMLQMSCHFIKPLTFWICYLNWKLFVYFALMPRMIGTNSVKWQEISLFFTVA